MTRESIDVKAVRHFGIVVSSMERSLQFYRDLLGLEVVKAMDESGQHIDDMLSLKNVCVTTVKLSASNGSSLVELLEFKSHPQQPKRDLEPYSVGPTHVAFTVGNLDAVLSQLASVGIPFNAPPQLAPDGGAKVTFCRDPDGTLLELVEELGGISQPPTRERCQ